MIRLVDTPGDFMVNITVNEKELDLLLSALHYWKDDYTEIESVFNKIQESVGFGWAPVTSEGD